MNVSLPQQLEEWVHKKVESGLYHSASEVVREALRLLCEQEELRQIRLQELRREIQVGLDQIDRGETRTFDQTVTAEVKKAGRKKKGASR